MYTYPTVAFPSPPPTSNSLSSHEHSASRKVLGDDGIPCMSYPSLCSDTSSAGLELIRTITGTFIVPDTESIWRKRKPTHLPPLLKLSSGTIDFPDSPTSVNLASSIVSDSFTSDALSDITQLSKLQRLRRKLGFKVPTTPVPRTPRASTSSKKAPRARTRSVVHQSDDARSIAFSIGSDESVRTVTFTTRVRSPRPHKTKHVYQTGALPPVPPIPTHLLGDGDDDDNAGLIRPRQKMTAGSMIGGSDFKAARRAKREGRAQDGMAEPGELMEMVGFMMF